MHITKPIVGISIGDLNGIGIETIIKTLSDTRILDICTPVIFGNTKVFNFYKKGIDQCTFSYTAIKSLDQINPKNINLFNCWEDDVTLQPGMLTPEGGKYAIISLQAAVEALKDGKVDGLVTAPIHKLNVQSETFNYTGHTPFLRDAFGVKEVVMMLYSADFRVALLSEHVPIAQAAAKVTPENISKKVEILHRSLVRDFGIDKPKIALLGLNPHAGDGGLIGSEEETIIKPTIEKLRNEKGWLLFGPYSADGFFAHGQQNKFDAVLAMYHDQGLIPLKSLGMTEGVNYTCGLPIVRTSPDHGTAFDIAGQDKAQEDSFRVALFECVDIIRRQESYDINTENPLQRQKLSKER